MTDTKKNKLNSNKQKRRMVRKGVRPYTFALTKPAKRAIRQVAINFDLRDYQALEKIIKECSLSKRAYKRFV